MTTPLKKTLAALLAGLVLTASASTVAVVPASALEPHGTGLKMRNWLVNDPDYTFSEEYRTSVWYQNFSTLRLGENDRNNVLRIAVSQLGYHEGNDTDDFDGMNRNGTENFMEYGRLLIPHYNNNSYDWCACFVNWCLNQARFDKASSEISCSKWMVELRDMKMWHTSAAYGGTYTPKPADFIFFDWDKTGKSPEHIGLVLYTTDTHVYTIEGNTKSNDVGLRSYPLNDKQILGYGAPPYTEGEEPTMDFSYSDGMPNGLYVVHDKEAALTDEDGQNPSTAVPLGSTVTLLSETDERVRVSYRGKSGYLPKGSVCLQTHSFTLTYDANGGKNPPNEVTADQAASVTLSQKTPTLRGDQFLGWSKVPYNCKVDYRPGEPIVLTGDTVLYAVWEKRSPQLAQDAAAEGLLPEYERPDSIQNSGAILSDGLTDRNLYADCVDGQITFEEEISAGLVPVFSAVGEGISPYATFSYDALCQRLELPPVTGEDVAYVVMKVKDAYPSGLTLKISCNGQTETASVPLSAHTDWQYVVFDLSQQGFEGPLQSLRLDWQSAAGAAESKLSLAEIFFAANADIRDAVLAGKYVFPPREAAEEETEPSAPTDGTDQTAPPDEAPSPSESGGEQTPSSPTPPSEGQETEDVTTEAVSPNEGCQSSLSAATATVTACGTGLLALLKKRKRENETEPR